MQIGKTASAPLYQPLRSEQAQPAETAQATTHATPDKRVEADFSSMTRRELFDWMNAALRNGEMTLDESTPFLAMTVNLQADGHGGFIDRSLDDTQRVDFLSAARKAMEFHRSRADDSGVARLEQAMEIMRARQNRITSVDISA